MSDFRIQEHGRLREISKKVDPYSLVFERPTNYICFINKADSICRQVS